MQDKWQALSNPFKVTATSDAVMGLVSGRLTDIFDIVTSEQSALILAGAPSIGKSALIGYLARRPDALWSWRNELSDYRTARKLDQVHFVKLNLSRLAGIEDANVLHKSFVAECIVALQPIYQPIEKQLLVEKQESKGLRELTHDLYKLLDDIGREQAHARCFVMLDTIEQLGRSSTSAGLSKLLDLENSKARTRQERGLAILDRCDAIRTLVDLIDEFRIFGVIISLESLPRPTIGDQFTQVSADLARFTTKTLQIFTWDDSRAFVAQPPEYFPEDWAQAFRELCEDNIFSPSEQAWLLEQAGTHPYLLQQFCMRAFHVKQQHASDTALWKELRELDKQEVIEWIDERLSTFRLRIWQRLQEALKESSPETISEFNKCVESFTEKQEQQQAKDTLDVKIWDELGPELRYIFCSEGILRHDPYQCVHYPGAFMRDSITRKVREDNEGLVAQPSSPPVARELNINRPGKESVRLSLSEREYHLLKTLLQKPNNCTEVELMRGAWGNIVARSVFTQRMHHLRKKLKDQCEGIEIIENRYGGYYSLNHSEWFQLG